MKTNPALLLSALLALGSALPAVAQEAPRGVGQVTDIRGHLTPRRFTTLASEMAAKVERISVREGERFKEGQTLVVLDCAIVRANLERARAVMTEAEKVAGAHRRLVELKSAGELEGAASALELAKARGEMLVNQATASKCSVTAPFAGRVVEQKARDQQFVQAGAPLLDILDDSALELEFIVPSRWLSWLKPGQPFQVQVEELGRAYAAKVTRLGAKVDPVSQSVKVVGEITAAAPELIAGMSGRIMLAPPN